MSSGSAPFRCGRRSPRRRARSGRRAAPLERGVHRGRGLLELDGYSPELRAGIHFGRPRKLGSDYFGVDVNVAARVADAAGPGEVLISEAVCEQIGGSDMDLRRRWRFKAKGAPNDLKGLPARLEG